MKHTTKRFRKRVSKSKKSRKSSKRNTKRNTKRNRFTKRRLRRGGAVAEAGVNTLCFDIGTFILNNGRRAHKNEIINAFTNNNNSGEVIDNCLEYLINQNIIMRDPNNNAMFIYIRPIFGP